MICEDCGASWWVMTKTVSLKKGSSMIPLVTTAQLRDELDAMDVRFGPAKDSVEAAYFHVTRAKASLDAALMAKERQPGLIADRLVHLAAVCMRFAAAANGE